MNFLDLPKHEPKPRNSGLTMVIDRGHGINAIKDLLETSADFIDYVKFGWGTSYITKNFQEKIDLLKAYDIDICLGGTFFELAVIQNKIEEYCKFIEKFNIEMIEVSDGTVDMKREDKLRYIELLSNRFKVFSEYGSKDSEAEIKAPYFWVQHMQEELDAGAWKVIGEGRESATAGMYRGSSELRTGLVDEIVHGIPHEKIIWEAPQKQHQVWFIKKFGQNVNLGNIAFDDVIPLETLRLGLRSDTLNHFHSK